MLALNGLMTLSTFSHVRTVASKLSENVGWFSYTRTHTEKFKIKSILQFLMNQMNKRTVFSFVYECITVFVEVISTFIKYRKI